MTPGATSPALPHVASVVTPGLVNYLLRVASAFLQLFHLQSEIVSISLSVAGVWPSDPDPTSSLLGMRHFV